MTEPSRYHTGVRRFPNYSAHKLRHTARAGLGEVNALPLLVARISRTEKEDRTAPVPRNVHAVGDVTRGLGLDAGDEHKIQRLVGGVRADFDVKGQTQRRMHARSHLIGFMRESMRHVDSHVRGEVVKRADALWKRGGTDYAREPSVVLPASELNKSGWQPIPGGKRKGERKRVGGKWVYRYPDEQTSLFGAAEKKASTGNKLADALLKKWQSGKNARAAVAAAVAAAPKGAALDAAFEAAGDAMKFGEARALLEGAEAEVKRIDARFAKRWGVKGAPSSSPAHDALRGLQAAMSGHMGRKSRPKAPNPQKEAARAADALLDAGKADARALEAFGLSPAEAKDTLAAAAKRREDSQGDLFRGLLVVPL